MILEAKKVSKIFNRKRQDINIFYPVRDVSMSLVEKTVTVLSGASGSGKSTLLNMMAGILKPDEGNILIYGNDIYQKNDKELSEFRNKNIGVVPQGQTAIQSLTVLENVLLPYTLYGKRRTGTGDDKSTCEEYAGELLNKLGISDLAGIMPSELSGGELRRMAIARALVTKPAVVLADEPTADLDGENTRLVLDLLRLAAKENSAVLVVTHDKDVIDYADVIYKMKDGIVKEEE